jgi:negative regulator of flagellin synthesis FlgM
MKIGPLESKPLTPATATERKPGAAASGAAAAEPSAKVELSPAAATSLGEAAADPTFDSAKVERIAQAIRDGKFEINPQAIADKLIVNAQELLGRKPS